MKINPADHPHPELVYRLIEAQHDPDPELSETAYHALCDLAYSPDIDARFWAEVADVLSAHGYLPIEINPNPDN